MPGLPGAAAGARRCRRVYLLLLLRGPAVLSMPGVFVPADDREAVDVVHVWPLRAQGRPSAEHPVLPRVEGPGVRRGRLHVPEDVARRGLRVNRRRATT